MEFFYNDFEIKFLLLRPQKPLKTNIQKLLSKALQTETVKEKLSAFFPLHKQI